MAALSVLWVPDVSQAPRDTQRPVAEAGARQEACNEVSGNVFRGECLSGCRADRQRINVRSFLCQCSVTEADELAVALAAAEGFGRADHIQ